MAALVNSSHGGGSLPYNAVNKTLALVETKKIEGREFGAFYMKPKEGDKIDLAKANFRIEAWDGDIIPLKCELLSDRLQGELSDKAKELLAQGYRYRIWIPRNWKELMDGTVRHSLPQGSVVMGTEYTLRIPLKPKKEKPNKPALDNP